MLIYIYFNIKYHIWDLAEFITVNVDAKKMDSLAEIVNKVNAVGVDVYARLATIEAVLEQLRGSSINGSAQASYVAGVPASL
jgi:hypothetical protein